MADLSTTYMGLKLKNPIVPSASPLSRDLSGIKAMEDAGASAIVLYSLFQEQIAARTGEVPAHLFSAATSIADAVTHFPSHQEYVRGPDEYVEHVRKAKESVGIPIIASLNGTSKGGWLDYASSLESAGADGLELNIYFLPTTDMLQGLDIETAYYDILRVVKRTVKIPVAVKLSPFFSAIPSVASQLDGLGANGLVLFNRFYQPDIDVSTQQIRPVLSLSRPEDILLPLRWIAILHGQVNCSLALTSGVHSAEDALKAILVGASVANVCSVLLKGGVGKLTEIVRELGTLMDKLGMPSVESVRGRLSLQSHIEPAAFERASYVKLLQSFGRI
jgi:dihydroorotate dehydrogenase (fumarate)